MGLGFVVSVLEGGYFVCEVLEGLEVRLLLGKTVGCNMVCKVVEIDIPFEVFGEVVSSDNEIEVDWAMLEVEFNGL